jgi:hypothetical protein
LIRNGVLAAVVAHDPLRERLRDVATVVLTPIDDAVDVDHTALS